MAGPAPTTSWGKSIERILPEVRELRRALHRRPEVAFREEGTARLVRSFLEEHGAGTVVEGIAGHGFLVRIEGGGDGPALLLRADLDALPLKEASGMPYASERDGKHHACGHDGHMAMLAGALAVLAARRDAWRGTVYGLFQPAEETGEGAKDVLGHDGIADLPVDRTFAFHNLPGRPLGSVAVRDGPAAVASTGVKVHYKGATSHASEPHAGRNPIPALAALAGEVTSAPAMCLPYGTPALATLIHVQAGGPRFGTSAGSGHLSATLRADTDDDLEALVEHVRRLAERLAAAFDLSCDFELVEPFPATVNDPGAVQQVRRAAEAAGLPLDFPARPQPWSEDYGHLAKQWPGALVILGAGEGQPALHSPGYDFPDGLLQPGIRLWLALVRQGDA